MTKSKLTKKALLCSILTILLSTTMLIGTTFAWFTDTASTSVNKIQAGTLDVLLEMKDTNDSWVKAEGKTLSFVQASKGQDDNTVTSYVDGTNILWEPGCTYELQPIRITNNGNLALKYKISISGIKGDAKLNEAIEWTINDQEINLSEGHLLPKTSSNSITIKGHMKEDAGNEYQDLSIDGIAITVVATQDTVEYDSYNNTYDDVDIWDGSVASAQELAAVTDETNKTVTINSAKLLAGLAKAVNDNNSYEGYTINLTKYLELNNIAWTPIGEKAGTKFKATFNGNKKTISGLYVTSESLNEEHDALERYLAQLMVMQLLRT